MTETPRERNRRTARSEKPEDISPVTKTRTQKARAPIGRSRELLERQEQLRQPARMQQPVQSQRQMAMYSDFAQTDFSARAAKSKRKKKRKDKHTLLWLLVSLICLSATGLLVLFAAPQMLRLEYAQMPTVACSGWIRRLPYPMRTTGSS